MNEKKMFSFVDMLTHIHNTVKLVIEIYLSNEQGTQPKKNSWTPHIVDGEYLRWNEVPQNVGKRP